MNQEVEGGDFVNRIELPKEEWEKYWIKIYVDERKKEKIINLGLLERRFHNRDFDRTTLSHHGAVLLAGPPGTGKTSLAKGAANELAKRIDNVVFKEINVQHLFSSGFGDTPQLVEDAFSDVIEVSEMTDRFQILLLDEVESLFSNRDVLTGDNDPYDAVRAVNEALQQLDRIAELSDIYIIATSNQPSGIDRAFYDRTDEQIFLGNPEAEYRGMIFEEVFEELNDTFDSSLPTTRNEMDELIDVSAGFSGRRIRKTVLSALTRDEQTVTQPESLNYNTVLNEFKQKKALIESGQREYIELGVDPEQPENALSTDDSDGEDAVEKTETESSSEDHLGSDSAQSETSNTNDTDLKPAALPQASEPESPVAKKDSETTTDSNENPVNGENEGTGTLDTRRVVFDRTERDPHLELLNTVSEFAAKTFGEPGENIQTALTADKIEDVWYELCISHSLQQVKLSVGELTVPIDISYEQSASSSLRVPSPDIVDETLDEQSVTVCLVVDNSRDNQIDVSSTHEEVTIDIQEENEVSN